MWATQFSLGFQPVVNKSPHNLLTHLWVVHKPNSIVLTKTYVKLKIDIRTKMHSDFNFVHFSPKRGFYDTGLACFLLDIEEKKQLQTHYLRGNLFESFVISELIKYRYNKGKRPNVYFWRNHRGNEVDVIIETANKLTPVEIKRGKTINSSFFDGLSYWNKLSKSNPKDGFLIYAGDENQKRSIGNVINWKHLTKVFKP